MEQEDNVINELLGEIAGLRRRQSVRPRYPMVAILRCTPHHLTATAATLSSRVPPCRR